VATLEDGEEERLEEEEGDEDADDIADGTSCWYQPKAGGTEKKRRGSDRNQSSGTGGKDPFRGRLHSSQTRCNSSKQPGYRSPSIVPTDIIPTVKFGW
jgi:hypothetical protein